MNSYKRSLYCGMVRIIANVLTLGAVFLAMYRVSYSSSAMLTFCLWFFGCSIPVWLMAARLSRAIRCRYPAEDQSFMELPGHRPCLVTWRVMDSDERLCLRAG
ncbi:MAG: hypothetical protein Q4F27_04905 [Desulfovibrionaceae bacterium]|nr:hypothetical protein [Desulfovibrionaceae bacterium]